MTKNFLVKMVVFITTMVLLAFPAAEAPTAWAQSSFSGVVEICQTTSGLRVRSGPGTNYDDSGPALRKGQKVVVFESIGTWARHGNRGWSSRRYLSCQTYTREQVTQQLLPAGYWLHPTAVDFNGVRLPRYDVVSGPDGTASQVFLPLENQRVGHVVSFTQLQGNYILKGVACELSVDRQRNGTLTSIASHTNSGAYELSSDGWLRAVCDHSPITGFSVVPIGAGAQTNSPYGTRESFVPAEELGQFLQYSYDCVTGDRLPAFDAVKEANGDIWYPWIPDEATRAKVCFNTSLNLIEGRFAFNGIKCQLFLDRERDGKADELAAAFANGVDFTVDTFGNGSSEDGESWGEFRCPADPHNGASIRWVGPLQ